MNKSLSIVFKACLAVVSISSAASGFAASDLDGSVKERMSSEKGMKMHAQQYDTSLQMYKSAQFISSGSTHSSAASGFAANDLNGKFGSVAEKSKYMRHANIAALEKKGLITHLDAAAAHKGIDSEKQDVNQEFPRHDAVLWVDAAENCRLDGGENGFSEFLIDAGEVRNPVIYGSPEDNIRTLVFDPSLNRLVAQHDLKKESIQMFKEVLDKVFSDLGLKGKGLEAAANISPTGPRFEEVLAGFKSEYAKRGVKFEYAPGRVSVIDPMSPDVRDYLVSINLHNKLIVAGAKVKTCDDRFVENALKEAKSEVAALKSCTGKVNGSLPFLSPPVALNCDGRDFAVIGGWTAKK